MIRLTFASLLTLMAAYPTWASESVSGTYVEARTCQVYTGPCFANGEVGSAGKDAIMAWKFEEGKFAGVDLSGQSVAVVVNASHTLGFNGFDDAQVTKAVVIVNASSDASQAKALQSFAMQQTGFRDSQVATVQRAEIEMSFNMSDLTAQVKVGEIANLATRKARPTDCICSNESAYYPPLTKLKGYVPGVTIDGEVTARKLGTRWSIPDTRSAYLGTFEVDSENVQIARK